MDVDLHVAVQVLPTEPNSPELADSSVIPRSPELLDDAGREGSPEDVAGHELDAASCDPGI